MDAMELGEGNSDVLKRVHITGSAGNLKSTKVDKSPEHVF